MSRIRPLMSSVSKLAGDIGLSIEDAGFVLSRAINARGDNREFDVWTLKPVEPNAPVAASEAGGSHQSVNRMPDPARPDDCSVPDKSLQGLHSPAQALRVLRAAQQCLAIHEARLLEGGAASELASYVNILLAANDLAAQPATNPAKAEGGDQ